MIPSTFRNQNSVNARNRAHTTLREPANGDGGYRTQTDVRQPIMYMSSNPEKMVSALTGTTSSSRHSGNRGQGARISVDFGFDEKASDRRVGRTENWQMQDQRDHSSENGRGAAFDPKRTSG